MIYVLRLHREGEGVRYWSRDRFSKHFIYASIYSSSKTALAAKRRIVDRYYLGDPECIQLLEINLNPYD